MYFNPKLLGWYGKICDCLTSSFEVLALVKYGKFLET